MVARIVRMISVHDGFATEHSWRFKCSFGSLAGFYSNFMTLYDIITFFLGGLTIECVSNLWSKFCVILRNN